MVKRILTSGTFIALAALVSGKSRKSIRSLQKRLFKPFGLSHVELAIASAGAFKRLRVVQVGANDGKSGDPVFKAINTYADAALLIEPQPWLMDSLRTNYVNFRGNLILENIAIGSENGTLQLHILAKEYWDEYIERVGRHPSLIFGPCREQVLKRIANRLRLSPEDADAAVVAVPVPVHPLKAILQKHDFLGVDILQIDCEGWDFEVIKSLGDIRPPIINFESANLTEEAWRSFVKWSHENEYGFIRSGMDTLALRHFPNHEVV